MSKPTYEELEAQVKQLAAENAALKSKGRELLGEACAVYEKLNKLIDPAIGDFIDGQTLHEFQFVLDVETKETDAILASLRAEGVEMLVNGLLTESFRMKAAGALADFDGITEDGLKQIVWSGQPPEPEGCVWDVEYMTRAWVVMKVIKEFAAQLRSQSEQVKGVQS